MKARRDKLAAAERRPDSPALNYMTPIQTLEWVARISGDRWVVFTAYEKVRR